LKRFLLGFAVCCLLFASCENPFMKDILGYKTVSFNSNGGSSVPSQSLFKGEYLKPPGDPVRPQFLFDGWYIDNDTFLSPWDFDIVPTGDMTLHAKWRPYGITLSPSNIVFDPQAVGYTTVTPETVVVTNTSDQPIGPLTISLSGANAGDFTLSASTMTSLALGDTGNFTVSPNSGLSVGTYAARVTVSNGSDISANINITFTVTGKILTISSAAHTKTYDGSTAAADVALTLNGILPQDAGNVQVGAVTASYTSANAGTDTVNITKVTLTGSAAGNYSVQPENNFTVTGGGITKAAGSAVTTPSVVGNPADLSITVSTTRVSNTGQTFEYAYYTVPSAQDGGWQTGNTFTLPTDALYYVFARTASNNNYETGAASASTSAAFYTVTFDSNGGDTEANPQSKYVFYNNTLTAPAAPTRAGYTFGGWYDDNTLTSAWNFTTNTVTAPITLYAKWEPNTAEIFIDVEQITEGVTLPAGNILISRTGANKTHTVTVSNSSAYSSITWEIDCVGVDAGQTFTSTGASFTLNAEDVRYNSLGIHILRLSVVKGGTLYNLNIEFEIVE